MEMNGCGSKENEVEVSRCVITTQHNIKRKWNTHFKLHTNTSMARLVAFQQNQLSFPSLASSRSDFHGTRLQTHIQVLHFTLFNSILSFNILLHRHANSFHLQLKRKTWQPKASFYVSASSTKKILIMGGTRFIGVFLSRQLVKEGHQVYIYWLINHFIIWL